jgi:3-polyprenyl-4-hydroxybenzoate decarboxylase
MQNQALFATTRGDAPIFEFNLEREHATSEIAIGSKLGIDATKKLSGEGFKRPWPPLVQTDAAVKTKVEKLPAGSRC